MTAAAAVVTGTMSCGGRIYSIYNVASFGNVRVFVQLIIFYPNWPTHQLRKKQSVAMVSKYRALPNVIVLTGCPVEYRKLLNYNTT